MNRTALTVLSLALLGSPLHAKKVSEPPKKPAAPPKTAKAATWKQLIAVSSSKGEAWTLDVARTNSLGYTTTPAVKDFIVGEPTSFTQLAALPTYTTDSKLLDVILSSTTAVEIINGQPAAIDGYSFRSTLDGRLISGLRASGKVGNIVHKTLDVASPETKARFDALTKLILKQPSLKTSR